MTKKITRIGTGNQNSIAVSETGQVYAWGSNSLGELGNKLNKDPKNVPQEVDNVGKIASVVCGGNHLLAISEERKLFCWGFNGFGQLGFGTTDFEILPQENVFFSEKNLSRLGNTLNK